MTENGTMRSKTKVLQGRQIRKWSLNLKKSLMNGVTRSKKHLKELTTIKNKTKIVVPKMSWTTGNKEWESSLVFLNNFEARTAEQYMKYLPPLQTILRINLEANQETKFIWLHLNGEALNWELLRLSMKLKIMLNICRHLRSSLIHLTMDPLILSRRFFQHWWIALKWFTLLLDITIQMKEWLDFSLRSQPTWLKPVKALF